VKYSKASDIVVLFCNPSILTLGVIISSTSVPEKSRILLIFSCSCLSIAQASFHISTKLSTSSFVICSTLPHLENIFIKISKNEIIGYKISINTL
jgi:hypothetical protein